MALAPPLTARVRTEAELRAWFRGGGRTLVALSGGVDSGVVASLAFDALGPEAVAVTLRGPSVSRAEVDRARAVAGAIGLEHHLVVADPLESAEYRANPPNRCYFCRSVEAGRLREFGAGRSVRRYVDGVHLDDLADARPGLRAMEEAGFDHPLVWAGWTKADVRRAAHARGLPNADQPSDACLASRVAHGEPIDAPLLGRIEAAEAVLLAHGFRRVRLRVRGRAARIEVDPDEVPRLSSEPLAREVLDRIGALGFEPVTVDPAGYGHARGRERGAP
jgi:pyridinium-3,5-biscarboxylic acid mononucleotide sulfurtransferase